MSAYWLKNNFLYYFMPFSNVPWLSYISTRLNSSVLAAPPKSFSLLTTVTFPPQYKWCPLAACMHEHARARTLYTHTHTHTHSPRCKSRAPTEISLARAISLTIIKPQIHCALPLRMKKTKSASVRNRLYDIFQIEIQSYTCVVL